MFGYNTQQPLTEGRHIMKLFVWNIYFLTEADQAKTEKTNYFLSKLVSNCNCETLIAVLKQFDSTGEEKKQAHDTQRNDSRGHQCPALEKDLTLFFLVNCSINPCLLLPV